MVNEAVSESQADERPCANPECESHDPSSPKHGVLVEPEIDGDHRYWECMDCGYAWGHERISDGTRLEGSCQVGIPEEVRARHSDLAEAARRQLEGTRPVMLGLPEVRR